MCINGLVCSEGLTPQRYADTQAYGLILFESRKQMKLLIMALVFVLKRRANERQEVG